MTTQAISGSGNALFPRLIQGLLRDAQAGSRSGPNGARWGRRSEISLTQREHDVLALLAEGRSNRQIAQGLYLSEKTVKGHLAATFRKLGVTNRTQAAVMAIQLGLGPISESPAEKHA